MRHSIVMRYRIRIPEGIKYAIISNSLQNMKWHDITQHKSLLSQKYSASSDSPSNN